MNLDQFEIEYLFEKINVFLNSSFIEARRYHLQWNIVSELVKENNIELLILEEFKAEQMPMLVLDEFDISKMSNFNS